MRMRANLRPALYLLALANLAVILFFWRQSSWNILTGPVAGGIYIALGRLFGLLGEYFLLIQLLLIGRVPPVEQSYSFDRLNRLHRWLGYGLLLFLPGHPLFLTLGYSRLNHAGLWPQFLDFIFNWEDTLKALLGLALLLAVGLISLPAVRRRLRYETWHGAHLLMYLVLALIFGHQIESGDVSRGGAMIYWLILNVSVFGLFLLYHFLQPLYSYSRHRFRVARVVPESRDVVSVYISGRDLDSFRFRAGQFANLFFLAPGFWQPHPFSFSAAPDGRTLRFSIKASGDFTARVGNLPSGAPVLLDGPLGGFTAPETAARKYLFLAGGIGITPIRALIESLAGRDADMVLFYANRSPETLVFDQELRKFPVRLRTFFDSRGERIDRVALASVPDLTEREIYICGPAPMLKAMRALLRELGAPRPRVHFEKFDY